jgi:hypothetical protein
MLYICIRQVLGSNFNRNTGHTDWVFRGFPQYPQETAVLLLQLGHDSSFQVLYSSSAILQYDDMSLDTEQLLLNNPQKNN